MAPVDTKLYELLGVETTATDADLRRAYKRQALRLHPDKGGNPDEFKKMKEAYDVLANPKKRKLYDSYGPEVVLLMDGNNTSPMLILLAISRVGNAERGCALCVLTFIFLIILSPLIMLSLRWDHTLHYPWLVVFTPLWAFELALLCLAMVCIQVPPPNEEDGEWDDETRALYDASVRAACEIRAAVCVVLMYLITAQVFIGLRLQETIHWSWFLVLLPWAGIEITMLLLRIRQAPDAWRAANPEAAAELGPTGNVWTAKGFLLSLISTAGWSALRVLTYVLVSLRGDQLITCSWAVCVIPWTVGEVLQVGIACCRPRSARTNDLEAAEEGEAPEEEESGKLEGCCLCFMAAFWLSMLYCGAFKLDGAHISAFLVFAPIFACMCTALCCFACVAFQLSPEVVNNMATSGGGESSNLNATGEAAPAYGAVDPSTNAAVAAPPSEKQGASQAVPAASSS